MIAKKLEPLVGTGAIARALQRRNVRQRALQQISVGKPIADPFLERGSTAAAPASRLFMPVAGDWMDVRRLRGCRLSAKRITERSGGGFAFAAAVHRTSVNNRSQRTAHGQRQISQACVPSLIEKKMICAFPMMFS